MMHAIPLPAFKAALEFVKCCQCKNKYHKKEMARIKAVHKRYLCGKCLLEYRGKFEFVTT